MLDSGHLIRGGQARCERTRADTEAGRIDFCPAVGGRASKVGEPLSLLKGTGRMSERRARVQPAIAGAALTALVCLVPLFFMMILPGAARSSEYLTFQTRQSDQDAVRLNVDLVVLHTTVQSSKRAFVSGLRKEDFHVYEDGVLQQIDSFSHEDIPVTVGLVIDNSGSMRPKRVEVIAAALAFARSSNANDQIFVVNFNENVSFGLPANMTFTDRVDQLEVALSRIATNGRTALYDAVASALGHLKKGNRDKKVLIVISDGADNASRHSLAQIITILKETETIIYTIALFDEGDPDQDPRPLKQLARVTGGEAFLPESVKEVVPICERIARDIRNQYTITYSPTNTKYDGSYRVIQVKAVTHGRGALTVRTRAGYTAPLKP
jgi:Ca-activated chloride channel homolog